eukprot:2574670-Prymnesium_polylepis.1
MPPPNLSVISLRSEPTGSDVHCHSPSSDPSVAFGSGAGSSFTAMHAAIAASAAFAAGDSSSGVSPGGGSALLLRRAPAATPVPAFCSPSPRLADRRFIEPPARCSATTAGGALACGVGASSSSSSSSSPTSA